MAVAISTATNGNDSIKVENVYNIITQAIHIINLGIAREKLETACMMLKTKHINFAIPAILRPPPPVKIKA